MPLSSYPVGAAIAVSAMGRAREFYEGALGLTAAGDEPDGGRTYRCAGGTGLHVFASPAHARPSGATVASWIVDDLEAVVDELSGNGVGFESYSEPGFATDAKGIAAVGDSKSAWFKDPDGNLLGLVQM
jgi:catechol 2,3-dioxygenase-like lactoylglutathione lyase family enzyme